MRESTYTRSIKRLLPASVYAWKINDRFTAGIPDSYYSAVSDLWVEYKWAKSIPASHGPKLSALQRHWLNARSTEGRHVAVIVGSPAGAMLFEDGAWNTAQPRPSCLLSPRDVVAWIVAQTSRTHHPCLPCTRP